MEKAFYFLSFLAVISSMMVVFSKNPMHSILYLIVTFFAISGHYLLLNAQFLALVNIIVYAGAIMVLFLFVVMFLNLNTDTEPQKSTYVKFAAVISGGLLFMVLLATFKTAQPIINSNPVTDLGLIKTLGLVLFKDFLLPFELVSILFLVAMMGAIILAKKEDINIR